MNVIETLAAAEQINRAGFSILSSTSTTLTVACPVQSSRDGATFEPVVFRTSKAVTRFIEDCK